MRTLNKIQRFYRRKVAGAMTTVLAVCFAAAFVAGVALVSSCYRASARRPAPQERLAIQRPTAPVEPFTLPAIPDSIRTQQGRARYLVEHYWDSFRFADTANLNWTETLEQVFVNYLDLLPHTTYEAARTSVCLTLVKARANQPMYDWFTDMYHKYLYDPNSPLRDEERYAAVVEHIIADPQIDDLYKIAPRSDLEAINKNRLGKVAADFAYTLADGGKGRLHNMKADYTLVFFMNPDCGDCKRTKDVLERSDVVAGLTGAGKMKVLAFYPDEDLAAWEAYRPAIPAGWIAARDASEGLVVKRDLYALRAIPSLYLLDRNKRVILKDAVVEQVIERLNYEP